MALKDWKLAEQKKNFIVYRKLVPSDSFPAIKRLFGKIEIVTLKPDLFVVNLLIDGRNLSGKGFKSKAEALAESSELMEEY